MKKLKGLRFVGYEVRNDIARGYSYVKEVIFNDMKDFCECSSLVGVNNTYSYHLNKGEAESVSEYLNLHHESKRG